MFKKIPAKKSIWGKMEKSYYELVQLRRAVIKRWIFISLIVIGAFIGLWHFRLAMRAVLVFRHDESVLSWVAILSGPLSTLPAIIVSVINRKLGSSWLIIGSLVSLLAMVLGENFKMERVIPFFYMFSTPMIILGIGFIIVSYKKINNPPPSTPAL